MARNIISLSVGILTTLAIIAWPFLIWLGLTYDLLVWLLPALILILSLRAWKVIKAAGPMRNLALATASIALVLSLISYLFKEHQLLLYYPVAVNLTMLIFFTSSLKFGMPIIERLARLKEPDLPAQGVAYTRTVTLVWSVFFVLNGSIALATALYGDINLWTTWNGLLSYLCMGLLMTGEWLVRLRIMSRVTP